MITNDKIAYTLAGTYAFCPPVPEPADFEREVDTGMYEPDDNEGEAERFFILAQILNGTNMLVLCEPDNLEFEA